LKKDLDEVKSSLAKRVIRRRSSFWLFTTLFCSRN